MAKRALALDLGSSSVRAIVFEPGGGADAGPLVAVDGAIARRPRHLRSPEPAAATFDADDYLADLVACIDELHARGCLDGVGHVAPDSQWHSIVPLDAGGRPRGQVVSWADTRAPQPGPLPAPDELEGLRQRTGCAFASLYWTWRVPWLGGGGDGGASPARFVGLSEYVGLKLLDDPSMSVSMASGTGLLTTATHSWDDQALELAGGRVDRLPPLAPPGWRGRLSAEWRRRWPALADAVWHPFLGDGAAANLGVGCDTPTRAALTVGTSAAARAVRAAPDNDDLPPGLWRYCIDHDRVLLGAAFSSGGQLYSWALALWEGPSGGGLAHEVRYDLPVPVGAGSEGVLLLPWHSGTRPPAVAVPGGQGCVFGLGLGHNGAHIVSAAAEAVCFQLAGGLEDLEARHDGPLEVVVNGGAIERSPWWATRLAATLGRSVRCSALPETTARGAAAKALEAELGDAEVPGELVEASEADIAEMASARRRWLECYDSVLPIVSRPGA